MNSDNTSSKEFGNELDITRFIEAILFGLGKLSVAIGKTFRDIILKPRKVELPTDIASISSLSSDYARPLTYLFLGLFAMSAGVAFVSKNDLATVFFMILPLIGVIGLHGVITSRVASKQGQRISSGFSIALSAYTAGTCAWLIVIFLPLCLIGLYPAKIIGVKATKIFSTVVVEAIGGIIALGLILRLIYCYCVMLSQQLDESRAPAAGRIWFISAFRTLVVVYAILFVIFLWSFPILSIF